MPTPTFGYTLQNVTAILHDLKTSTYFRIWAFLCFVAVNVGIVAFFILSIRSSQSGSSRDWQFWISAESMMSYPSFHFQCADNLVFNTFSCVHHTQTGVAPVLTRQCPDGAGGLSVCRTVIAEQISASFGENFMSDSVTCIITTNNVNATDLNQMIKFQVEGGSFNPSTWVAPNRKAVIGLSKMAFATDSDDDDDDQLWAWRSQLEYHDSRFDSYSYAIEVTFSSFSVQHFELADSYDGWRSTGDIGGFAYLLVMFHVVIMWCVNLFMEKNSKFLNGQLNPSQVGYSEIGSGDSNKL